MVILTGQAMGAGVTKASMKPARARAAVRPTATVMRARPSAARAVERLRGPGTSRVQNSLRPAAPAMKMQVSSSSP